MRRDISTSHCAASCEQFQDQPTSHVDGDAGVFQRSWCLGVEQPLVMVATGWARLTNRSLRYGLGRRGVGLCWLGLSWLRDRFHETGINRWLLASLNWLRCLRLLNRAASVLLNL